MSKLRYFGYFAAACVAVLLFRANRNQIPDVPTEVSVTDQHPTDPSKPTVLVINAHSRQGGATVDALLATSRYNVVGSTRSGTSAKLSAKGVNTVPFHYGSPAFAAATINAVQPSTVFFVTLMRPSREQEASEGKIIVDACKAAGISFVVFTSVADADRAPDPVAHFKAKFDVEEHLKASGLNFAILRPVAFYDNVDDPANWNPLTKGSVKMLWSHDVSVKMVSCIDIGKAAAVLIGDQEKWGGKTLDCAADIRTGDELATDITEVTGVKTSYSLAIPMADWVMWMFMSDLYHMVEFFKDPGYSSDIAAFKEVVPDALTFKDWVRTKKL